MTEGTESLLAKAKRGDRAAFDQLCAGRRASLERLARSRMGTAVRGKVEPEDIVQETLLRAFESIHLFRGCEVKAFANWVAKISEHLIWNASQKALISETPLVLEVADRGVSPSRALRREERLTHLHEALARLKPQQRTVVELAKLEGLRVKDIAERMGLSEGAVKQLLFRALRGLRTKLDETESLSLPDRFEQNEVPPCD